MMLPMDCPLFDFTVREYKPMAITAEPVTRAEIINWLENDKNYTLLEVIPLGLSPFDFVELSEELDNIKEELTSGTNLKTNTWYGARCGWQPQKLGCFFYNGEDAYEILRPGGGRTHIAKLLQSGEELGVPVTPVIPVAIAVKKAGVAKKGLGCITAAVIRHIDGKAYIMSCEVAELPAWTRPIFNKVPLRQKE